ncbi:type IV toxin-antitoxin system AbiEi family antitoxin domain-containing protein [Natronosporangium hydrolyticum]|uniref:Type IV toxin-antitoxin system AbiEi family antitoxin domain-containing protein n=1 Tax=Natronosporangium hydrolyticum TaxID=2811111 RepID=A0A895YLA8_9ACTN|nr:type IV toxin-antitoxin system AbiEi family antitoxin domain-containing protein [Natronosporangium hydrolyticum]QSB14658.1 type IV toxin-antitoxin system AbiEi family antitoxin domain-containing protein [Natronosporangium hydrolyticum]
MESAHTTQQVLTLASKQDGIVTARQCRQLGISPAEIKARCRSGRWRRIYRGTYLVMGASVAELPARVRTRAGLLAAGPHSVAVLSTAAAVHGIEGLPPPDGQVHLSLPGEHARARRIIDRQLALHQLAIKPAEITKVDGLMVTTPLRTVADLILRVGRFSAVSIMDSALHQQLISEAEFATLPQLIAGRRGAVQTKTWVPAADARAASPLETRVRLRCADGGVAPDVLQYPVLDLDGELLGIADFAWLGARVLGEADGGEVHSRPDALFRDRWRQNALANAGWRIIRFTWEDTLRPGYIPYVVRQALAGAHPGS